MSTGSASVSLREKIIQDTERDNFMTAQEAKEYGIIDEVIANRPPKKEEK